MTTADLLIGGALAAGSAAWLVRGWLRASRDVAAGLAIPDQGARDRHPSRLPRVSPATPLPPARNAEARGSQP